MALTNFIYNIVSWCKYKHLKRDMQLIGCISRSEKFFNIPWICLLCLFQFSYLHQLLLFYVKHDTFPNLLGANIQYIEEYYNFSESYFYLFSNNKESAHCIKSLETRPYRKDNQVVPKKRYRNHAIHICIIKMRHTNFQTQAQTRVYSYSYTFLFEFVLKLAFIAARQYG